ncbi:MBG domain-containing protein [Aliarcobacter lanthieri]|uniref:two-partner secretion domain-containing protein n=1 Tax=Aliarcobacter lanthieri TaxID=1355374 RepID=UPI003AAB466F
MKKLFEFSSRFRILKGGLISLVVASNLYGAPSGGTVVNGTATINQAGNTTNINQSTNKSIINWQSFNIGNGETVNFNQPNSNSITLNRVVGNEKSIIDGALNANGQVWLINSNGILFGKNSKVNTSGILASTKDILNDDFLNGNYNFKGNSKETILNEGEIKSLEKTYATFIANSVTNKGKIEVYKGTIHLVGGSDISLTLDENSNISLKVNKGVLDALVENNNLIVANGGNVYLTTNAKDELLKGVVNNSGIIEANSIDNLKSEVIVFAHGGKANISGTIEAKDGFIETSGKSLNVTDGAKIVAKDWLIDPENITIENSGGSDLSGESISATAIQNALGSSNVTLQADNNIYVNENITMPMAKTLILQAGNDIYINGTITVYGMDMSYGKLSLVYAQTNPNGNYYIGNTGKINLDSYTNFITKKGSESEINWTVIRSNNGLQNMGLSGNYVLSTDFDLDGYDWTAIGDSSSTFSGRFDGLGHTISNLKINKGTLDNQGLFGFVDGATIRNIGLKDVNIQGKDRVGGLVGVVAMGNAVIENSYVTGVVKGNNDVGGLVGRSNAGTITNSYSTATVTANVLGGNENIGGLVGHNYGGMINNSYATGNVTGKNKVGGLVGYNNSGVAINNSYSSGTVNGATSVGGLVGSSGGTILNSYATGTVSGTGDFVGGLLGNGIGPVTNSFYNKTVNPNMTYGSSYGKTTAELQNANTFKNAGWTIIEDSSLAEGTPILKDGKWYIKPASIISLVYNLDTQTKTYTGQNILLGSLWNPSTIFGNDYASWILGTDYNFIDSSNNIITSYINAGTYNNILVQVLKDGYQTASSGNNVGSLVINKANLSVMASSGSKTYDGLVYNSNITYTGFVNNQNPTVLTGTLNGGISEKNAGTYTTNLSGLSSDNYNISYTDGTYTINKANLTATLNNDSKTYDGIAYSGGKGVSYSGFVNNETSSVLTGDLIYGGTSQGAVNAGTYSISGSGLSSNNYNIIYENGIYTINKADLTISSISGSKTYDGLVYNSALKYDGFVNNEDQTVLTGTLNGIVTAKDAGYYTTKLSGLSSDNYNIKYKNGTYTISKKIINLAIDSKSKKQGEENPQLTYVANGLIDGDTLNVILQTNATTSSPAGKYIISLDSSTESANKNYDISYQGAYLVVLAQVDPQPEPKPEPKPEPQPEPKPEPQPEPKPEPNMQKIVDSIDRITHINTTEYQSTNNILEENSSKIDINQNVEVIALSSNQNIRIIDGGIKMPGNIAIDINLDENDK